ncbi:MAG: HPF/RaiA family ribosome-associated protein [Candidatus Competibacter denitrificans]
MNIHIRASGIVLTDEVREYVERRLQFAFGWADERLLYVAVRLSDENGPRGGEDKRCRIQINFAGAPNLVVDDTEADLYVAIDRAADRAGRSVARRLERQRDYRQRLSPLMTSMRANTPTLH